MGGICENFYYHWILHKAVSCWLKRALRGKHDRAGKVCNARSQCTRSLAKRIGIRCSAYDISRDRRTCDAVDDEDKELIPTKLGDKDALFATFPDDWGSETVALEVRG